MIECLLSAGSDINALDNNGLNPMDYLFVPSATLTKEFGWRVALAHFVKLQVMKVSLPSIIVRLITKQTIFSEYLEICNRELAVAKNRRINNSWVSFLNVLVDGETKLSCYACNEDLLREFWTCHPEKIFPVYGAKMSENVKRGVDRRKLCVSWSVFLSNCIPNSKPDHLVIRKLLDHFSMDDLLKVCE